MCLIVLSYAESPHLPLLVAANRDEFRERPAAPLAFWEDHPDVLAGRDLKEGGTWLGVTRSGRMAALTNVRDPIRHNPGLKSRGHLVRDFLIGGQDPEEFGRRLARERADYNGYNLLFGTAQDLRYYTNELDMSPRQLTPGLYGLSNEQLDTPWPKVVQARAGLRDILSGVEQSGSGPGLPAPSDEELFRLMADERTAPDEQLPDTGIGLELERVVAPVMITAERYGTRCTSALSIARDGSIRFSERTYDAGAVARDTVTLTSP